MIVDTANQPLVLSGVRMLSTPGRPRRITNSAKLWLVAKLEAEVSQELRSQGGLGFGPQRLALSGA